MTRVRKSTLKTYYYDLKMKTLWLLLCCFSCYCQAQHSQPLGASRIQIAAPKNEATIRSNQGVINIKFAIDTPLTDAQFIIPLLDGKQLPAQKELQLNLANVDRGEHLVQALLVEQQQVISQSRPIIVYLHRATKIMQSHP